ncbi:EF-hand domain-containing protein [Streptomyces sp. SP17BM10]|uniref:EF-hand domain-containing protein n=1 Tax=Streptomyces sp. SP17BM10 TaxID=3002530 RepID=UPI002E75B96D|nr:EF-hand domain-containing protein [Streptomyces sp. SP17BM10]MEE1788588.1 EF-hand domain-containing protein [Streptomyces sp. SP17BM10]
MSDEAKRRIFTMLDSDGDGVITHDEYLARVDRAASACGRDPQDPLVAAARAAHEPGRPRSGRTARPRR